MTVSVEWADGSQRALRFKYLNTWTWDDYFDALNQSNHMIAQVHHPVNVIDDFGASHGFPHSTPNHLMQYAHALNERGVKHFIVGGGDLWRSLWTLLVRHCPSLEHTVIPVTSITGALRHL